MRAFILALAVTSVTIGGCSKPEAAKAAPADLGRADWEPDCRLGERDDPEVRNSAWAQRDASEPICLFAGAMAWAQHDPAKAQELYALALIRRRYDVGRCVTRPQDELSSMMMAIRLGAAQSLNEAGVRMGPEQIKRIAKRDAAYAYRTDHLNRMCGGQVKPAAEWPTIKAEMLAELER